MDMAIAFESDTIGLHAKRAFDVAAAFMLLALCWPAMLAIALLVRVCLGAPVLFRQQRAGLQGRPFVILKFRTLLDVPVSSPCVSAEAERSTRLGSFLRRSGLDELPQLWNVLRGDMSLVGPRPLYMRYIGGYTPRQSRRLDVRPGITGYAQINGRTGITWPQQFEFDVHYVENRSMRLDMWILWRTFAGVVGLVPRPRHVWREEFSGQLGDLPPRDVDAQLAQRCTPASRG
jgi:lipopolysaccharide/colanic/teichoic acid biosynthesis glycosyltransferase